jgi:hypothetical protein
MSQIGRILQSPNATLLAAGLLVPNQLSLATLASLVDIGLPRQTQDHGDDKRGPSRQDCQDRVEKNGAGARFGRGAAAPNSPLEKSRGIG